MNVLVIGANGFIGKNLIAELNNIRDAKTRVNPIGEDLEIFAYDADSSLADLEIYCRNADFVFHLAGVNRPEKPCEFMEGNFGFTTILLDTLKKHQNYCPVMISSSTQAALNTPYGMSKKAGEDLLFEYAKEINASVLIYRFPNVFGKWCRPNYNNAVVTFCNNIANDLPIQVNDSAVVMNLVYIDDVVSKLIRAMLGNETLRDDFSEVPVFYTIKLGEIIDLIYSFKASRKDLSVPYMANDFTKKLYSTYLSYLPTNAFSELSTKNECR